MKIFKMAHPAQKTFCKSVKKKLQKYFKRKVVVDIGSLDINGSNKYLFSNCVYTGVDVIKGKNVDIVMKGHEYLHYMKDTIPIDVVISTEALEHDKSYELSLHWMYHALKPGGLLLITCAGDGREEHGTTTHAPDMSPGTNDYYKNVSNEMFAEILQPDMFTIYHLEQNNTDLQFYGIKKY